MQSNDRAPVPHKTLEERYAEIGVAASDLARYFNRPVAQLSGLEYDHLSKLLGAIQRRETTWSEQLDYKLTKDLEARADA